MTNTITSTQDYQIYRMPEMAASEMSGYVETPAPEFVVPSPVAQETVVKTEEVPETSAVIAEAQARVATEYETSESAAVAAEADRMTEAFVQQGRDLAASFGETVVAMRSQAEAAAEKRKNFGLAA